MTMLGWRIGYTKAYPNNQTLRDCSMVDLITNKICKISCRCFDALAGKLRMCEVFLSKGTSAKLASPFALKLHEATGKT
jgi:hypothetical protein